MSLKYITTISITLSLLLLTACGSGGSETKVAVNTEIIKSTAIINNSPLNDYKIIIYGNSHSSQLGGLLNTIITAQLPNTSVKTMTVSGRFLDEIVAVDANVDKLKSDNWSHSIFQGQKYSQSGSTDYPTSATERLISNAKEHKITPILFPEHPQKGDPTEAKLVYDLHLSISKKQPSCIAPVGFVWNRVLEIMPSINLHSADGNHASYAGNVLTAMTFYQIITSELTDTMPFIPAIDLTQQEQALFAQVVTEVLELYPACGAK
ncbi:hypothetical protein HHL01_08935 [Pseudoalteromonas arctica]|jgi:hypothetical protein|uniref:Lipoprotein n=1 Tax=Pseudoalteromonas arctica TaxID=394751 RepID=A0A7X9U673_9GAMM|nr:MULTISPECIES: hypothetical protein [Pseudoalteromonas]MBH0087682.1 hypothetical protein [Pseudoalteromonas sp. NSLLW218]NMF48306.1 hypothetical protein [Pseudoalteromonas arctica]